MTAFVDVTANVVKRSVDDGRSQAGDTSEVSNLLERLEMVAKARDWSDRQWCERAEISPTYIGTLKTRFRQTDGTADARATEMMKLARAANVSLAWLIGGEGDITDRFLPETGKGALIRLSALDAGIPENIIENWMRGAGNRALLSTPVDIALSEMRADMRRARIPAPPSTSRDLDEIIDAPPPKPKRRG